MEKNFDVSKTVDDMIKLDSQIKTLQSLMTEEKQKMARYFESSGEKNYANDFATVFVQERTTVEYDIPAIVKAIGKERSDGFISKRYEVEEWDAFVEFLKSKGIIGKEIRPFFSIIQEVNKDKLSKLYESGDITINELEGCYTAKVVKSIALRVKDVKADDK